MHHSPLAVPQFPELMKQLPPLIRGGFRQRKIEQREENKEGQRRKREKKERGETGAQPFPKIQSIRQTRRNQAEPSQAKLRGKPTTSLSRWGLTHKIPEKCPSNPWPNIYILYIYINMASDAQIRRYFLARIELKWLQIRHIYIWRHHAQHAQNKGKIYENLWQVEEIFLDSRKENQFQNESLSSMAL